MIVGAVALIGASIIAIYGLPFESKTSADQTAQQLSQLTTLVNRTVDQVNSLAMNQAVMQETVKTMSVQWGQIDDLRKTVEQMQIHVEGLEADAKADDSARLAARMRARR